MARRCLLLCLCAVAACGGSEETVPKTWQTLVEDADMDTDDLGASVLSAFGRSRRDIYFAGGTLGVRPRSSLALHFDGDRWERLPIDVEPTLWWVTVVREGSVWFAGEEGTVVRWRDGEATVFDSAATGTEATLFGIWGSSDTDMWSVGGDVTGGDTDVLLHFDGSEWTRVAPPEAYDVQFFKVWGSAPDDVFVVGTAGLILHFDGESWSRMDWGCSPCPQLFTVHGRGPDDVWTVGSSMTILHFDGESWESVVDRDDPPFFGGQLSGVWAAEDRLYVVGNGGVKVVREPDGTWVEGTLESTGSDLHSVWGDSDGYAFAVGGNYIAPPGFVTRREAAIAYRGAEISVEGLPELSPLY